MGEMGDTSHIPAEDVEVSSIKSGLSRMRISECGVRNKNKKLRRVVYTVHRNKETQSAKSKAHGRRA